PRSAFRTGCGSLSSMAKSPSTFDSALGGEPGAVYWMDVIGRESRFGVLTRPCGVGGRCLSRNRWQRDAVGAVIHRPEIRASEPGGVDEHRQHAHRVISWRRADRAAIRGRIL